MKSGADYVQEAKAKLGNPRMSDREFGVLMGCSQSLVAQAKHGQMTDPFALKLASVLGDEPGEILMVARLERERDAEVKSALIAYAGKIFASVSSTAAAWLAAVALGFGLMLQPLPADAATGGVGRLRNRR